MTRKGDWMQTYTGKQFWPIDPRADEVCIIDIAHSLSMQCRYNGHTKWFYSVAEHCCHIYDFAPVEHKPWALLHDASEAYLTDIPRPLKPFLAEYKAYEQAVMAAVAERFGFDPVEPAIVKELDTRILGDEKAALMVDGPEWYHVGEMLGVEIGGWQPWQAEKEFLMRFNECDLRLHGRLMDKGVRV